MDREKQLDTFRRMYAMGNIPEITVRQKMAKFNISDDEIDAFFAAIHAKETGAAPPLPPGAAASSANGSAPPPPPASAAGAASALSASASSDEALEGLVLKQVTNIQEKLIPYVQQLTMSSTEELHKLSKDQIDDIIDLAKKCDPWSIFELESYASSNADVVVKTLLDWLPAEGPGASEAAASGTQEGKWRTFFARIKSNLTPGQKMEVVLCVVECT